MKSSEALWFPAFVVLFCFAFFVGVGRGGGGKEIEVNWFTESNLFNNRSELGDNSMLLCILSKYNLNKAAASQKITRLNLLKLKTQSKFLQWNPQNYLFLHTVVSRNGYNFKKLVRLAKRTCKNRAMFG